MSDTDNSKTPNPSDRIKDSAQQIWLAGLGAFAKMQQEGSKAFEALVKDGAGMQKRTQDAAEETLTQAQRMANDFSARAAGGWGKLESLFEQRVAQALERLGMPSADEVSALQARVQALEAEVRQLRKAGAPAPRAARKTPPRSAGSGKSAAPAPDKPSQRKPRAAGRG